MSRRVPRLALYNRRRPQRQLALCLRCIELLLGAVSELLVRVGYFLHGPLRNIVIQLLDHVSRFLCAPSPVFWIVFDVRRHAE